MRLLFLVCVCIASSIWGEIYEIKSVSEILLPKEAEKTLVVFDIDNTLIKLNQELGSDSWFYHRFHELVSKGMQEHQALQKAIHEFNAIQNLSKYELVERAFIDLFAQLDERQFNYMGLTIRGFDLSCRTIHQLHDIGIEFDSGLMDSAPCFIDNKSYLFWMGGVVFTFGKNKGEAICKFLDTISKDFDHVIVVDDKLHHLQAIESHLAKNGIRMTGYRYGFLDHEVAQFCPVKASEQFLTLLPLIEGEF
jgi:hypothetical protein